MTKNVAVAQTVKHPNPKEQVDLVDVVELLHKHITKSLCAKIFRQNRTVERQRKWTMYALAQFWIAVILRAPKALTQALEEGSGGRNKFWPGANSSPEAFFEKCKDFHWSFFGRLYVEFGRRITGEAPCAYNACATGLRRHFPEIWVMDGSQLAKVAHRLKILWHRTTAYEQNGYFDVIFKALETLDKKYIGKLLHIGFGMINLKSGKMSSRTGEMLGAVDVIEIVKELSKEQNPDSEVAQKVAIAAIKYSFLKNNPLQSIAFDINESVAREGNSGPYLQYTVARINSVVAKSEVVKTDIKNIDLNDEELMLLRKLSQFQEIIVAAGKTYSPNILCNYLYDLASKFNTLYNKHKIIGSKNEEFRLLLAKGTGQVLKNGLKLLGIESPEKM